MALSAGLEGRAQRLGDADRKSSLPIGRTHAGLAAAAADTTRCRPPGRHERHDADWPGVTRARGAGTINPMTDRYGVVGHPVVPSGSPFIHSLFARDSGQTLSYRLFDFTPQEFEPRVG